MSSTRRYVAVQPYWVLNEAELTKLKKEAGELRDLLAKEEREGRGLQPTAMRARARLGELEREIRAAIAPQHDPNTGALLVKAPGQQTQTRQVVPPMPWWKKPTPALPPPARAAAVEYDHDGTPVGVVLMDMDVGQPPRVVAHASAGDEAPRRVLALNAGDSFADQWAAIYEAMHPGEQAFVG